MQIYPVLGCAIGEKRVYQAKSLESTAAYFVKFFRKSGELILDLVFDTGSTLVTFDIRARAASLFVEFE